MLTYLQRLPACLQLAYSVLTTYTYFSVSQRAYSALTVRSHCAYSVLQRAVTACLQRAYSVFTFSARLLTACLQRAYLQCAHSVRQCAYSVLTHHAYLQRAYSVLTYRPVVGLRRSSTEIDLSFLTPTLSTVIANVQPRWTPDQCLTAIEPAWPIDESAAAALEAEEDDVAGCDPPGASAVGSLSAITATFHGRMSRTYTGLSEV